MSQEEWTFTGAYKEWDALRQRNKKRHYSVRQTSEEAQQRRLRAFLFKRK